MIRTTALLLVSHTLAAVLAVLGWSWLVVWREPTEEPGGGFGL